MKIKTRLGLLFRICPYAHLWDVLKKAIGEHRLPESARQGATIALLGLCCPLFWIAYFSGARGSELVFHAVHSGIFVLVGLILTLVGLAKSD